MVNRPKGNGAYAPLAATYYRDDAVLEVGEKAELLFVRGLAYSAEAAADGYISDRQLIHVIGVGMRDASGRAGELVRVGLWERVEGGYVVRSWLKWNRTAADIGRVKAQDRERKAAQAKAGIQPESERIPAGIPPESNGNPNGIQPESERIPALARAGAVQCSATTRHDTTLPEPTVPPGTAQTLIAEWIDRCQARPPSRVIGQVAKHVAELLAEGTDPDHIRQGLDLWQRKGLHPSTLASVVNEAMNSSPYAVVKPKPSTTDAKLAQTLSLLGQYERQEIGSG